MKFIVITISLGFVLSAAAVSVFTPADVRFARYRCQESTTSNETLRRLWKSEILPDESQTHCFVKCVLGKLGLINLGNRGLDATKICDQFKIYGPYRTMLKVWLESPLNGTCVSYFEKWRQLEKYLFEKIKHIFYGVVKEPSDSYETLIKCRIAGENSEGEVHLQDSIINWVSSNFGCQDYCIFREWHFFDAYGRVDQNEIVISFREAGEKLHGDDDKLAQCVHFANSLFSYGSCRMASELKFCLVRKLPKSEYVFAYRNEILKYL